MSVSLSQSESSATNSQDVAATDTFLNRLSFVAESEEENSEGRVRCCGRTWDWGVGGVGTNMIETQTQRKHNYRKM